MIYDLAKPQANDACSVALDEVEVVEAADNGNPLGLVEVLQVEEDRVSQNRVKAMIHGGGGPKIMATTSNGLITLETRETEG